VSLGCPQKQKRPHGEGVGPGLLTLAGLQEETPPEGGVGPEMLSPAGLMRHIVVSPGSAVKPDSVSGGQPCSA